MIHPTAIVSPEARLGAGVSIGPYAMIEEGTEIGDGCAILAHAVVRRGSVLGEKVEVHAFTVVGGPPQMLKFDESILSGVRVGARTILRESVTLNRSTKVGGVTVIGADCFIMACAHVAHDCVLDDRVIMANAALMGGHCRVGAGTFLGGGAALHQFVRVGEGVMIGGHASITLDLPPFLLVAERDQVSGLNLVGLKRRGLAREVIAELKDVYRRVYAARNPRTEAATILESGDARSAEVKVFLAFFDGGKRGVARPGRIRADADQAGE